MSWSEEKLHVWLAERWQREPASDSDPRVGSFGHDAAVLRSTPGRSVLCVDQTLEGIHYEPGTPGLRVGRKAAARALSDLAATAARPEALLLSIHAPASAEEAWIRAVIEGVDEMAGRFGARLVGGDLALASGAVGISVSAQGRLVGRARPPGRDRASAGELVLITGPVGGSRLDRHLEIVPRIEEGIWLFEMGASALMDVSDGLRRDLDRIARASQVRIEIAYVPIHPDAERAAQLSGGLALEHALGDGEDHELLVTLSVEHWAAIREQASERFPTLEPIGIVANGEGCWWCGDAHGQARPLESLDRLGGWTHGR